MFPTMTPHTTTRHYKSSSLILLLVGLGIKLLGNLNHQFHDLCTARALSGLNEE